MTSIDWSEVYRGLRAGQEAMERGWRPAPEERKRILRARARALAREPKEEEAAEGYLEVAVFLLAYETYGIESRYVREVYPLRELTSLPCAPPFVLGIVNVRGQILPVIDLKRFFDLPEKGLTDLNKLIIVQAADMELGILADAILGVWSLPLGEIQPSLPTLTGIRAEYLRGVTNTGMVILDGGKILSDQMIVVHDEVKA